MIASDKISYRSSSTVSMSGFYTTYLLRNSIMNKIRRYKHNPPHLFVPDSKYFITASTLGKFKYLKTDAAKEAALKYLIESFEHFGWELEDWVILDNHIHLMADAPKNAKTLRNVLNNFHKFTANWLSRNCIVKQREKYFHNYWDKCISYQKSYYARVNYIWHNPVKHGYVTTPDNWKFGSYFYRLEDQGNDIEEVKELYPIDKLEINDSF